MSSFNVPQDAQYYIIKNASEEDGGKGSDWTEFGIRQGDEVYFKQTAPTRYDLKIPSYKTREEAVAAPAMSPEFKKQVLGELFWWNPKDRKWIKSKEPAIECMYWEAEEHEIHDVISAKTIAEITVKVAQIFRDYGIKCHYNEDLNCIQSTLIEGYFDEWQDQPVEAEYGAYDYWEAVHKKLLDPMKKKPIEDHQQKINQLVGILELTIKGTNLTGLTLEILETINRTSEKLKEICGCVFYEHFEESPVQISREEFLKKDSEEKKAAFDSKWGFQVIGNDGKSKLSCGGLSQFDCYSLCPVCYDFKD